MCRIGFMLRIHVIFLLAYSLTVFAESDDKVVQATTDFSKPEPYEEYPGGSSTHQKLINEDVFSFPSANMSFTRQLDFAIGNRMFTRNWASIESGSKGIGPLFNARSCQACHFKDGRGHLPLSDSDDAISLILKLGNVSGTANEVKDSDPIYGQQFQDFALAEVPPEGKLKVSYSTSNVKLADGSTVELRKPEFRLTELAYGKLSPGTFLKPRIAPQMIGLGLLQAISEDDIKRNADPNDENDDGISGRVSYISYGGDQVLGRFGWKAEAQTLKQQSQLAFFNDMGLSSEGYHRNSGDCTKSQEVCLKASASSTLADVELDAKILDAVTFYVANLAVPKRRDVGGSDVLAGKQIFYDIGCASCHRPKYITQESQLNVEQSRQLIWPYTDLLLHDMGRALADPNPSVSEVSREWRTPPLWGIGLTSLVNQEYGFLHDGRARTLLEAILWHGGEAQKSRDKVTKLSQQQRKQLINFLNSL